MAPSPESSAFTNKVPTLISWEKLFPNIAKSTVKKGMMKGQQHWKLIRENSNTKFAAIVKRLGRKISLELKLAFLDWLNKHSMVIESPIAKDTLLVPDHNNPGGTKVQMNKILLQISIRELHNDMLSEDPMVGLLGCKDVNGNI